MRGIHYEAHAQAESRYVDETVDDEGRAVEDYGYAAAQRSAFAAGALWAYHDWDRLRSDQQVTSASEVDPPPLGAGRSRRAVNFVALWVLTALPLSTLMALTPGEGSSTALAVGGLLFVLLVLSLGSLAASVLRRLGWPW